MNHIKSPTIEQLTDTPGARELRAHFLYLTGQNPLGRYGIKNFLIDGTSPDVVPAVLEADDELHFPMWVDFFRYDLTDNNKGTDAHPRFAVTKQAVGEVAVHAAPGQFVPISQLGAAENLDLARFWLDYYWLERSRNPTGELRRPMPLELWELADATGVRRRNVDSSAQDSAALDRMVASMINEAEAHHPGLLAGFPMWDYTLEGINQRLAKATQH